MIFLVIVCAGLGALFIPVGGNHRYGPFHAGSMKPYQLEDHRGTVHHLELLSISYDTVTTFGNENPNFALDSLARISQDGLTYYRNPRSPARPGERFASERQKWEGEERWTVGSFLVLLGADALGLLH